MSRRLNIWCPLPPSKTGTAIYVAEQLAEFKRYSDVCVVLADFQQCEAAADKYGVEVVDAREAIKRDDELHIIHLANNSFHAYCFEAAQRISAFLVVHDGSLHHMVTDITLARGDKVGYLGYLTEDAAEYGRYFALQRDQGFFTEKLQFYVRCMKPALRNSLGVITHSIWAKEYFRTIYGVEKVLWTPLHCTIGEAAKRLSRDEARKRFGLHPDRFTIVIPGFLSPVKDLSTVLALAEHLNYFTEVQIFVAGEGSPASLTEHEHEVFDHLVKRYNGYLSDDDFDASFVAADVISCLRYPTTGESSAVFSRAIAAGRIPMYTPVLGGYEPSGCGVPVSKNQFGLEAAKEVLQLLVESPEYRSKKEEIIFELGASRRIYDSVTAVLKFVGAA